MEYLFFGSSCNRASSVLLVTGKRFGRKRKTGELLTTLRLTHQDVAGLAGLTRETTSVELKKLERKGIISYDNRKIVIKDLRRLEQGSLIEGIDIKSSEVG